VFVYNPASEEEFMSNLILNTCMTYWNILMTIYEMLKNYTIETLLIQSLHLKIS
jgi:hypothetical protein